MLKGSKDFHHSAWLCIINGMSKNGFAYVFTFFSLISDGLDSVGCEIFAGFHRPTLPKGGLTSNGLALHMRKEKKIPRCLLDDLPASNAKESTINDVDTPF